MKKKKLTYGYKRMRDVPNVNFMVRICTKCNLWFASRPKEQVCDGCVPPKRLMQRKASDLRVLGTMVLTPTRVPNQVLAVPNPLVRGHKIWGSNAESCLSLAMEAAIEIDAAYKSTDSLVHRPDCQCDICYLARPAEYKLRPETLVEAQQADEQNRTTGFMNTAICPLPQMSNPYLTEEHKRMVWEGCQICSCG